MEFSVRSPSRPRFCWQLRSQCLELGERTRLMAIVNLSTVAGFPDAANAKFAVAAAVEAVDGGADIVELGSAATRTGAQTVNANQECSRLLPVLEGLLLARPKAIVERGHQLRGDGAGSGEDGRGDSQGRLRLDVGRGDGRGGGAERVRHRADARAGASASGWRRGR